MSLKTLYQKTYTTLELPSPWKDAMGKPENKGCWIIYGAEKNGKTWFALMLAQVLSKLAKTLYISGEEGVSKTFQSSCIRAGLSADNSNLKILPYTALEELRAYLKKRRSAQFIFFDNTTVYEDELKNGGLRKLLLEFPDKLFIFIAHEEDGKKEPFRATAKLAKKLADIIMRVEGLTTHVYGRCPGGFMRIHDTLSKIYYGQDLNN